MKPVIVIKTGGRPAEDTEIIKLMAAEMKSLESKYSFVFVHGGGAAVSRIQKKWDIEPVFIDGRRMTGETEMELVDMGLSGLMNTGLVRLMNAAGHKAVGLSGADARLITGKADPDYQGKKNCTGSVVSVNPAFLTYLTAESYLPVVCSVSSDSQGNPLNINADEAALAVASGLNAERLIFISDIPGVLDGEKKLISSLDKEDAETYIESGVIAGGMVPKIRASFGALDTGTKTISISDYGTSGDLEAIIAGNKGTLISEA